MMAIATRWEGRLVVLSSRLLEKLVERVGNKKGARGKSVPRES